MESKLSHIADRVNMKHNTYRKAQSVVMSKRTCKEKPSNLQKKSKGIEYEMSANKLNPEGLDFPDNFMAVMGWRRTNA
jgi:hypothetical protein